MELSKSFSRGHRLLKLWTPRLLIQHCSELGRYVAKERRVCCYTRVIFFCNSISLSLYAASILFRMLAGLFFPLYSTVQDVG